MISESEAINIIKNLTGVTKTSIKVSDDGFLSRGYIIDNGKIVFKFPRSKSTTYENEIRILNLINQLINEINLQKVGWISEDDSYIGLYGVKGISLENILLSKTQKQNIGRQLALFLKRLHQAQPQQVNRFTLAQEISAWQERYTNSKIYIQKTILEKDQVILEKLMMDYMPKMLISLGENLVFSHGDLGDGNIFLDKGDKVGVIDFNSSGYFEEAADFMDFSDDELRDIILDEYQATEELRRKVELRKDIRAIIVLKQYMEKGNTTITESIVTQIRQSIAKYRELL